MNELEFYFQFGLEHVLDLKGYDHALFLIALTVSFQLREWKRLIGLVTFFTLGHTLSLYLSSKEWLPLEEGTIEILIPTTILLTALYTVYRFWKEKPPSSNNWILWAVTLLFGIIHGFGFGRYYNEINDEGGIVPIVSFAAGIEVAQLIIVIVALLLGYVFSKLVSVKQSIPIMVVSVIIAIISAWMTVDRLIEYFRNI